jgi:hypothetical protein
MQCSIIVISIINQNQNNGLEIVVSHFYKTSFPQFPFALDKFNSNFRAV